MFLMIENSGEADVRSFTTLGLSTSRGDSSAIGQFGSGAKHGILLLLRQGINPYIYCGKTRIEFYTKPNMMGEKEYNSVFCRIGTKTSELSYCLEFGALDWDKTDMALREFISNAIDQSEDIRKVKLEVVEKPRAKAGTTRVFVPLSTDVNRFYSDINNRFLHFSGKDNKTLLDKKEPCPAKVYRKGVLVRQLSSHTKNSIFDYNLGEELAIDESRNLDDWKCQDAIGSALSKDKYGVRTIFTMFASGQIEDCMELRISQYHLTYHDWWKDVWQEVAGDKIIVPDDSGIAQRLVDKGFSPVVIPSGWYNTMKRSGITVGQSKLTSVENKGCTMVEATENAKRNLNDVWGWLVDLELTNGKSKPPIICFSKSMDSGSTLFGYCENNTIYINIDYDTNKATMLEELAHYITGSGDNSRDLQDFAFSVACRMGELIYS